MRANFGNPPGPLMSLKIKAIDHVQVTVPPELAAAALDFYSEFLGLTRVEKPAPLAVRGGAWYQLGATQLHISIEPEPHNEASKRHICYLVDNLVEAKAAARDAGIEITEEAIEPNGLKRFFIRDPAGNRIEIGQRT